MSFAARGVQRRRRTRSPRSQTAEAGCSGEADVLGGREAFAYGGPSAPGKGRERRDSPMRVQSNRRMRAQSIAAQLIGGFSPSGEPCSPSTGNAATRTPRQGGGVGNNSSAGGTGATQAMLDKKLKGSKKKKKKRAEKDRENQMH